MRPEAAVYWAGASLIAFSLALMLGNAGYYFIVIGGFLAFWSILWIIKK